MKAVILEKAGGIENLIHTEIDKPSIGDNEVLVKVYGISINPADAKIKYEEAGLNALLGEQQPHILGWDIAGEVVAIGKAASKYNVGDKVFGMVNFPGRGSAYAEYVAAPEAHLAKIPEGISYTQAAATTLAALTAYQVLSGKVKEGDRVLIHAGSGGVGHFAIQIAKSMGAYVVSTSSAKNKDFIMSLGADEHIDYRTQAFEEVAKDINFVFDVMAGDVLLNSAKVIQPKGTIVSIAIREVPEDVAAIAKEKDVTVMPYLVQSNGAQMEELARLMQSGQLKPRVSKTFSFDKLQDAHTELESGRTVGKVVVTI